MKLEVLEAKVNAVGELIGRNLRIVSWGRRYQVQESFKDTGIFTLAWLPAQDLWNRLDMAESALRQVQKAAKSMTTPMATR